MRAFVSLCDNCAMRLVGIVLFSVSAWAQTGAPVASPSTKPSFDKAAFEASIRYYEALVPDIAMKIGDPKPAPSLPGFSEVPVHLSYGQDSKDEVFYLSSDGQTVVPAESGAVPAFHLGGNPFQLNLDKLVLKDQPRFGPANAPITIGEFGDLE